MKNVYNYKCSKCGNTLYIDDEGSRKEPEDIIADRDRTHGDWKEQSELGHSLKHRMVISVGWSKLNPSQMEALEMIQTKISRILTGDATHEDHWDDIAGYAKLGKGTHDG